MIEDLRRFQKGRQSLKLGAAFGDHPGAVDMDKELEHEVNEPAHQSRQTVEVQAAVRRVFVPQQVTNIDLHVFHEFVSSGFIGRMLETRMSDLVQSVC